MQKTRTGGAVAVVLAAVTCAHAQDAVQWRVEDGGNGHWYQRNSRSTETWDELRAIALGVGGDLASVSSHEENLLVRDVAFPTSSPSGHAAIGGLNSGGICNGTWTWVDGTSWGFNAWDGGQPDCSGEEIVIIYASAVWHDYPRDGYVAHWTGAVFEWSADCNDDGIVDYGQILDGTFADEDGNGVPDCCEGDCPGDLNGDDSVGPPDLGILLAVWGTDGGKISGADINGDGTVNAADLGLLVGAWGDCGCH